MYSVLLMFATLAPAWGSEISAGANCFSGKIEGGDSLTVTEPCEMKTVPVDQHSYKLEAVLVNMPSASGETMSRYRLSYGNDSYEITVLGNPSLEDVRARRFKTPGNANFCMRRRRFVLENARTSQLPGPDPKALKNGAKPPGL